MNGRCIFRALIAAKTNGLRLHRILALPSARPVPARRNETDSVINQKFDFPVCHFRIPFVVAPDNRRAVRVAGNPVPANMMAFSPQIADLNAHKLIARVEGDGSRYVIGWLLFMRIDLRTIGRNAPNHFPENSIGIRPRPESLPSLSDTEAREDLV